MGTNKITQGEWKVVKTGESWMVKEWAAIANIQYGGGDSDFIILAPVNTETLLHMEAEANAEAIANLPNTLKENKELKRQLNAAEGVIEQAYDSGSRKSAENESLKAINAELLELVIEMDNDYNGLSFQDRLTDEGKLIHKKIKAAITKATKQ